MDGAVVCRKVIPFFLFASFNNLPLVNVCVTDTDDLIVLDPLYLVSRSDEECKSPWIPFVSFFPPYRGCALKLTKVRVVINGKVYNLEEGTVSPSPLSDH